MMRAVKKPEAKKIAVKNPAENKRAKPVPKNASPSTAEMIRGLRKDVEVLSSNADRLLDRLRNL